MKLIGTHNGLHHPDDVIGCFLLKSLNPGSQIIRTRDKKLLSECDFLVDIGGDYNKTKGLFDHHQKEAPIRENGVPYSASGLVWKDYGRDYIKSLYSDISVEGLEWIWMNMDEKFFLIGDMLDNHMMENNPVDIFNMILSISDASIESFNYGMELSQLHINFMIKKEKNIFDDNQIVKNCIKEAIKNKQNYVFLPKEMNTDCISNDTGIFFAIFPYSDGTTKMIRCLGKDDDILTPVFPFQEKYRGLLSDKLIMLTNNPNHLFVHHKGFCAGSITLEDAKNMINMTTLNI